MEGDRHIKKAKGVRAVRMFNFKLNIGIGGVEHIVYIGGFASLFLTNNIMSSIFC